MFFTFKSAYVNNWSILRYVGLLVICAFFCIGCENKEETPVTLLRVSTTPEGAEVLIDGEPFGHTPVLTEKVGPGEHNIVLLLEDYERVNDRFKLEADGQKHLEFELVRDSGTLTISSTPPGAKVYITDQAVEEAEPVLIGETPIDRAKVTIGRYNLELKLDNHEGASQEIEVKARDYKILEYSLKALTAHVQIYSVPTAAQIYIDDELYPAETPARVPLVPGEYSIGVYMPGYNVSEEIFNITPNGKFKFEVSLEKGDMPLGMVLIPAGEFVFGADNKSPDERPMISKHLPAFYMDKYEVTNADYKKVVPSHTYGENEDKHPVKGVSWGEASSYAAAIGKRLPTEEEWEKAARGAEGKEYPWGTIFIQKNANTLEGGSVTTKKIGSYKKGVSDYGCFDMSGNVYEWTSTWYNPYKGNPEVSIEYGTVYRVLRGGSYLTDSFESRSARRHYAKPDTKSADFGFRCAKDLTQ